MNDTKPWHQSTTIWGSIVAIVCSVISLLHFHPDQQWWSDAAAWGTQVLTVVGAGVALWGRLKATKQIAPASAGTLRVLFLAMLMPLGVGLLSGCISQSATTQPAAPDNTANLTLVTNGATFTLTGLANARDNGLLSQADVNAMKPAIDAFAAARAKALAELQAGDTDAYADALAQLTAAYQQLAPLLAKIPATQPVSQ